MKWMQNMAPPKFAVLAQMAEEQKMESQTQIQIAIANQMANVAAQRAFNAQNFQQDFGKHP